MRDLQLAINNLMKSLMYSPKAMLTTKILKACMKTRGWHGFYVLEDAKKLRLPLAQPDMQLLGTMLPNVHVLFEFLDVNPEFKFQGELKISSCNIEMHWSFSYALQILENTKENTKKHSGSCAEMWTVNSFYSYMQQV